MMFRSLFYVAPVLALDQQQRELLQRASSELSSGTLRTLEENLAAKGGCQKYIAAEVKDAHYLEADTLVAEWKEKFNYKRKVKKDVKMSKWCVDMIDASPAKTDADFKDTACKTLEKTKKQCVKSLKATCKFTRSTLRKLLKKAQKGSRKIRKEATFKSTRDALKTKVNAFSCKEHSKVKPADLKSAAFAKIKTDFEAMYDEITDLKDMVDTNVAAKDAKKKAHKDALKAAADAEDACEDKAETDGDAAEKAAKDAFAAAKTAAEAGPADEKKAAIDAAKVIEKAALTKAKEDKKINNPQVTSDLPFLARM